MRTIEDLAKPYILSLEAYSSARGEYAAEKGIWLDANENNFGNSHYGQQYHRYPDPLQGALKKLLAQRLGNVSPDQLFIGNGSDEALDLLFRVFIEPGIDAIAYCSPTYGMYKVLAKSHNAKCIDVPLNGDFQLDVGVLCQLPKSCKLLFLCSPNNPTGNALNVGDIERVLNNFDGLVILDEAYIHFSSQKSWVAELEKYPNLLITQTFSKAHGLAALRLGYAIANPSIIALLNKVKMPYNMNLEVMRLAESYLKESEDLQSVSAILIERQNILNALKNISGIVEVFPSDANFILFTAQRAMDLYTHLRNAGVVIRNRHKDVPNALRVSVGLPAENTQFISLTQEFYRT